MRSVTGAVLVAFVVAGCSSGDGKYATPTTARRVPTPMTCIVRAAGSRNADGAPPRISDFPPADVTAPAGTHPITASRTIKSTLVFGVSNGRTPPSSDATATELSYRSAQAALGERPDPRIAPNRCVWEVTVDALYDGPTGGGVKSAPAVTVAPATSYSVLFDVNSGLMFEIVPTRTSTSGARERSHRRQPWEAQLEYLAEEPGLGISLPISVPVQCTIPSVCWRR